MTDPQDKIAHLKALLDGRDAFICRQGLWFAFVDGLTIKPPTPELTEIEAVAEAWASIDGKLDEYRAANQTAFDGYKDGYQSDAAELIARVKTRGWVLVPAGDL